MRYFILCFCLITTLLSLPEKARSQAAFWGVKAGVNLCKVTQLDVTKSGMTPGFHIGIFATFIASDKFSFTHEVLFSRRGVNLTQNDSIHFKQGFNYIEIPWTVNYHLSEALFISAGIQPSFSTYLKLPIADSVRIYNKSNVNPIDFSFIIGGGGYFTTKLGGGVRLNMSVVNAFDLNDKGKNIMLQAYVCYGVNRTGQGRGHRSSSSGGGYR